MHTIAQFLLAFVARKSTSTRRQRARTVQREAVVRAGGNGDEPGRWARARPPRGRCRGGRTCPAPTSTPPRYLQTTNRNHLSDPEFRRGPGRIRATKRESFTGEGERVGLAGGDGDHLGRHPRGAAVEWRRREMRRRRRRMAARVQVEALPREGSGVKRRQR